MTWTQVTEDSNSWINAYIFLSIKSSNGTSYVVDGTVLDSTGESYLIQNFVKTSNGVTVTVPIADENKVWTTVDP
jgi:hypothetical protein